MLSASVINRVGLCGRFSGSKLLLSALSRNTLGASTAVSNIQTTGGSSFEKSEIQKWGWTYLIRQRDLKRPLSPHLTVYKPQLTWMVSGLHRISGVVMGSVVAVAAIGMMGLPFDFTAVIEFIRSLGLPFVITAACKFVIAWPIVFHTLNGIRFLAFDIGIGLKNIGQVYQTGWAVVGLSLILAAIITLWPQS